MKIKKAKTKKLISVNEASPTINVVFNIVFILLCITCVFPVLLVIGTSFADEQFLNTYGYSVFPKVVSLDAYVYILNNASIILRAYVVSIVVTIGGTVLHVLVSSLYGYALSRKQFKYRKFFLYYIFFTMLFSGGTVPWYMICMRVLHINDTLWAMILPLAISAWNVIILKTFFSSSVPEAIIEAARIDGASEIGTFFKVVWPVALPGIATIALFAMLGYWNDYWHPMLLINDNKLQNLQLYLYNILQNIQMLTSTADVSAANSGHLIGMLPKESARMAMCVITIGPIIFAYPFFQRYFIQGLTVGAVKG